MDSEVFVVKKMSPAERDAEFFKRDGELLMRTKNSLGTVAWFRSSYGEGYFLLAIDIAEALEKEYKEYRKSL